MNGTTVYLGFTIKTAIVLLTIGFVFGAMFSWAFTYYSKNVDEITSVFEGTLQ